MPEAGHLDRRELRSTRSRRRCRIAIVAGAAAVAVLVAGVGVAATSVLGGNDGESSSAPPTPSTPPASITSSTAPDTAPPVSGEAPATTPPAETPLEIGRRYAVGTYTAHYVDTTRSTSPNGDFGGAPFARSPHDVLVPGAERRRSTRPRTRAVPDGAVRARLRPDARLLRRRCSSAGRTRATSSPRRRSRS